MFAIDQDPDSVTVHYKTEAGRFSERGDYAVCTLPFSVLRSVEMHHALLAREAARDPAAELPRLDQDPVPGPRAHLGDRGRHPRRRHRDRPADPPHELPDARSDAPPRGVLLASYTWGQDALQWGAMDDETRQEEALDDVARIHPRIREVYEVGASYAWYGDRWARGAFAMFAPEQQTQLQADIVSPEGRIHFAGEHCSLYHAWIQGALESGIRAARQIHEAPQPQID